MTATPKTLDPLAPMTPSDVAATQKLPPAIRKVLASTLEKDWPKLRVLQIESEEAGELVDMLPEMNRVMKYCPARLMGRVGRREITADQLDKAYTQLHDSLHGVRQALHALLHLAGFQEYRSRDEGEPSGKGGPADAANPAKSLPSARKPIPAI